MSEHTLIVVPRENNNDELVTLVEWRLRDFDEVQADQVVAHVEGSKAIFEVVAPSGGFIRVAVSEGQEVAVGGVLARLFASRDAARQWSAAGAAPAAAATAESPTATARNAEPRGTHDFVRFSKHALALIEQRGLDPSAFAGHGLVRARDVQRVNGEDVATDLPRPAVGPSDLGRAGTAASVLQGPARRHALTPSKRTETRYIGVSHRSTLPSSVTVCVPTRGLKAAIAQSGAFNGNPTALLIYEAARLLRKYPLFNACYENGEAFVYEQVNVGFAVDSGAGLKVPVIRNADGKTPAQIAAELWELLVAYTTNELTAENQSGGTFTITDLSGNGAFVFEPLINKGQSAILGVGAEFFLPGSAEGFFNLTLRFDHQLAEGRTAASFLNDLAARLKGYEAALANGGADAQPSCARCFRTYDELRAVKHYLVQTVNARGAAERICTGCLQGW